MTLRRRATLASGVVLVLAACGGTRPQAGGAPATDVPPPVPVLPVPTDRQMAWQERELVAFAHFGVNTFTDREWGEGKEDPAIFNPTELDCRQWARACKAAGMKTIILTAKHHDGFCLWPSRHTPHSVQSSPWKGGKGDVIRELAAACRAAKLDLGLYLSPWDRHEPTYGDSPKYNAHYVNQLTEILTDYGPVAEVWFDGACGEGPNGKKQVYDFDLFWGTVRKLQPMAVMFSDVGPDIRWVGNERGYAKDPNWSTLNTAGMHLGKPNTSQTTGDLDGTDWIPAEADVSIRPGWFYHAKEDGQVKSLKQLLDIYYHSVGLGCVLLLNIPPDRRGLFHENDVRRLQEFGEAIAADFKKDLARGRKASADNVRGGAAAYGAERAVDGDPSTYWATDDGVLAAALEVDLGRPQAFNRVVLQEYIRLGQRVKGFVVEAWVGAEWKEIGRGQTIGYKRILRIPDVTAQKVRLRITEARGCPTVSALGITCAPAREE